MLVLTRKKNERIRVGPDIWVTVVEQRGDKVRLGIEAPTEIPILREEVIPQELSHVSQEDDSDAGISGQ
ncbi:carbon storage regulator [Schlesneria paludicola]|uniref:carbon storage regulator n=1 Tax=Schlesneria paludicola TaxID=360056 RepID=UPI00029B0981|nr:carbon storage regulator [Schlesneria paludicola]